jgi:hypothetical protein
MEKVLRMAIERVSPTSLRKLPLEARLFMRVVTALTTKEQEGEFLNPSSVRSWATELRRALGSEAPGTPS